MKRLAYFAYAALFVIGLVGIAALISQPLVQPVFSTPPEVDAARLQAHVQHLSAQIYPRSFDFSENLDRAGQYVHDRFKASGARVSIQDVLAQESKYKNIVARFGPETGPLLVIGAHYDSYGDASAGAKHPGGHSRDTHTPGADDNASGVAGLIELARLLGQKDQSRAIELVAYTLEEPPHFRGEDMGSVWHAKSLLARKQPVDLMISLEMIGYFSDESGSQSYPIPGMSLLYSSRGDFIALVGAMRDFDLIRRVKAGMMGATRLPVYSINAPALLPGIDFSDHRSYWNVGIPALMVTDTAFFRNKNYHLPSDTYEKLDYKRMAQVVQAVFAVTQGL
jgi:Zn-dependent M28 family amino/carboxypeptidase